MGFYILVEIMRVPKEIYIEDCTIEELKSKICSQTHLIELYHKNRLLCDDRYTSDYAIRKGSRIEARLLTVGGHSSGAVSQLSEEYISSLGAKSAFLLASACSIM